MQIHPRIQLYYGTYFTPLSGTVNNIRGRVLREKAGNCNRNRAFLFILRYGVQSWFILKP